MLGEFSAGDSALHAKNDCQLPQMAHYNTCHSIETITKKIPCQKIIVTRSLSHVYLQQIYTGHHLTDVFSLHGKSIYKYSDANT